jgi:serine/threonine protein kinase
VPGLTGLTVLARGGYATIYQAVQESVGRDVAVKIENRSLESDHDKGRFLREARAAGRMSSHPHVVDLFDAGVTADGHPYLIMELCAGSYADRIRSAPLGPIEVRDVGAKIADALADAHDLGVLHRDVKPANILVSGFGEPALADFGLAVLAEARDVSTTLEVLTPAYAPREMFRHSTEPSPAADVYSLCATLYALLRGKPPRWQEDRNPSLITLIELFDRPIPDLPGVPSHLLDLLRAGMCNDPAGRPSARELTERLAAVPMPADSAPPAPDALPARPVITVTGDPPDAWSLPTQPRPTQPRPAQPQQVQPQPPGRAAPGGPAAGPGPDSRDGSDPGRTMPVPRRGWPFAAAGAAVLLLGLIAAAGWYGVGPGSSSGRQAHAAATLGRGRSTSTGRAPSGGAGGGAPQASDSAAPIAAGRCVLGMFGAACPGTAQCFDQLAVSGGEVQARSLPCTGPHTWEVFALGTLPSDLSGIGYSGIRGSQNVARLCNPATLTLVDLQAASWQIDVLPPSPAAFAGGDRTFRCLAGTGPNKQTTSVFGR